MPSSTTPAPLELGPYLRDLRDGKHMSLRDVETQSHDRIKSGYLSQLERGQILRPSPRILWLLAEVYGIDYPHLLTLAGYELPRGRDRELDDALRGISLSAIADLNDDDRKLVRDFVEILRARHVKT